jgi:hypothetical protein
VLNIRGLTKGAALCLAKAPHPFYLKGAALQIAVAAKLKKWIRRAPTKRQQRQRGKISC